MSVTTTADDFAARLRKKRQVERECEWRIAGLREELAGARQALADARADLRALIDGDGHAPLFDLAETAATPPPSGHTCATCGAVHEDGATVYFGRDHRGQCRACFEKAATPPEAPGTVSPLSEACLRACTAEVLFPPGTGAVWPQGVLYSQALGAGINNVGKALDLDPDNPPVVGRGKNKGPALSPEQCRSLREAAQAWVSRQAGSRGEELKAKGKGKGAK